MKRGLTLIGFALLTLNLGALGTGESGPRQVNVYSHRHYESDRALFAEFTRQTGITVNVVEASADQLIERLKAEGEASPADVLITVDAGRLERAREQGLLRPLNSPVLQANIPVHLRHPQNFWFGLTKRARVIVYNPDKVQPAQLSTYAQLAEPAWRGQVILRSSSSIYHQSLVASRLATLGPEATRAWVTGLIGNLAQPPAGGDRDNIKAVALGQGSVTLVNTYYLGQLLTSANPEEVELARRVRVFFPDQAGAGTHVNVSGAGQTRSSKNVEEARLFLEFLSGDQAQRAFAAANHEYPVKTGVPLSEQVAAWGTTFKEDTLDLAKLGEFNAAAVRLMEEAGWK